MQVCFITKLFQQKIRKRAKKVSEFESVKKESSIWDWVHEKKDTSTRADSSAKQKKQSNYLVACVLLVALEGGICLDLAALEWSIYLGAVIFNVSIFCDFLINY